MIKLVYDLKAGFEDCYITIKNESYDFSHWLESFGEDDYEIERSIDDEADLYKWYKDYPITLVDMLKESHEFEDLYEQSITNVSKIYFTHRLGGIPTKQVVPIWEPSNWRLEYDPAVRSPEFYRSALPAKEVCSMLNLTRQQLHYYVKTGQIRKEYNPENNKQFKYNVIDVYMVQRKLEKKYDRYK